MYVFYLFLFSVKNIASLQKTQWTGDRMMNLKCLSFKETSCRRSKRSLLMLPFSSVHFSALKKSWHVFVLLRARLVPKMREGGRLGVSISFEPSSKRYLNIYRKANFLFYSHLILVFVRCFFMFCTCSQCHKWVLSQIIPVWLKKKQAKLFHVTEMLSRDL